MSIEIETTESMVKGEIVYFSLTYKDGKIFNIMGFASATERAEYINALTRINLSEK